MEKEIFHFDELFHDVQMASIFEDGKTFPDCIPARPLEEISNDYLQEKMKPGFNLSNFINKNFTPPKPYETGYTSNVTQTVNRHIESLWNELTRVSGPGAGSLIPLPFPYVVPGGRFREIYYWDSYFTMLGLRAVGRIDLIKNMINNFAYLIDTLGYIPNGNRTYFLGRSQPPFFSSMVTLLNETDNQSLVAYLPQLEKEYFFWTQDVELLSKTAPAHGRSVQLPDGSILSRYWDTHATPRPESYKEDVELSHQASQPSAELFRNIRAAAESGWDFSTRWFKENSSFQSIHTTEIIPIDLNCLLYHLEKTLSEAWRQSGSNAKATEYSALCENRIAAINKYCWNEAEGFFFDYDFVTQKQKDQFTLAGAFPLFFRITSAAQAKRIALILKNKFLKSGGLVTTLVNSGQQWDAPNGWAPLQWIAFKGLMNYGHHDLATEIKNRWLARVDSVFKETGKMMEKYNVVDTSLIGGGGEYPNQDGFGWTNGVTAAMLANV